MEVTGNGRPYRPYRRRHWLYRPYTQTLLCLHVPACACYRCADYVVVNKVDLLAAQAADGVEQLGAIVASLNPLATVFNCENGVIPIDKIFGREAQVRSPAWPHSNQSVISTFFDDIA